MSGRGGLATFFLFLFLSITILLQVLSIIQSDRLYERLNHLDQSLEGLAARSSILDPRC
jgi:hypothetical protein